MRDQDSLVTERRERLAEPKRVPKYLLVTRYAAIGMGDEWYWQYLEKTYDTLDAALDALNWTKDGKYIAANTTGENYFVGLWELTESTRVPVSSEEVVKVERRIQEHRSERTVWTSDALTGVPDAE
jgi:hypothetical protein